MSAKRWRSRVRGVLEDGDGRVLAFAGAGEPALPEVWLEGFADDVLEEPRRALAELLGREVTILRSLRRAVDRLRLRLDVVYEVEADVAGIAAAGARWLEWAQLPEDLHDVVETMGARPVPAERADWAQAGWLPRASAWITAALEALERPPTGPVEQVRMWPLSAVLRTPTQRGLVYFKATTRSPLFVNEGRVMQGLARLFPRRVPKPLAVEHARRWMLLDDLGPPLGWEAPLAEREAVLWLFAHVQVSSTRHLDALLAMGCLDRRPAWLARETRKLLADDAALANLEPAEVERLRELEPVLVSLCRRVADGPLPDALVHGDLHLGNVARTGEDYVFFDWSDACVTHPFLDLIDVHREEDPAARERLRDMYLVPWSDFASRRRLLELWELARPLAFLNQAVSYRHIMANVELGSAPGLDWALPHWLRLVLDGDVGSLP